MIEFYRAQVTVPYVTLKHPQSRLVQPANRDFLFPPSGILTNASCSLQCLGLLMGDRFLHA
jgi:hypothetical protein